MCLERTFFSHGFSNTFVYLRELVRLESLLAKGDTGESPPLGHLPYGHVFAKTVLLMLGFTTVVVLELSELSYSI